MKRTILALALACGAVAALAVSPTADIRKYASNYYAYPIPESPAPALTATPAGYTPFHIEHYGRHGSRWHIGKNAYARPVELMEIAERNGKLTERGVSLLAQLRDIKARSVDRDGELTPLGARQHRGIARRMYANFPEIFADGAHVDARSTQVIRCILSMDNELQELKAANPKLNITSDASAADMWYMNADDSISDAAVAKAKQALSDYTKSQKPSYQFVDKIITDRQFASDSIKLSSLLHYLAIIAFNSQSHDDMPDTWDIFSEEELHDYWVSRNAQWFQGYGNTRHSDNLAPFSQRHLLRNFIASADTAVASGKASANLRFGHEVCVLPLVVLMELDHYGEEINDFAELEQRWHNYDVFPMASNVQMIFYRPVDKKATPDNVLVKVLLNEKETTLPIDRASGPYYRWSDVKKYYESKLSRVPD